MVIRILVHVMMTIFPLSTTARIGGKHITPMPHSGDVCQPGGSPSLRDGAVRPFSGGPCFFSGRQRHHAGLAEILGKIAARLASSVVVCPP
eukprot:5281611-Pyramimonas_sp.AAC.1